MSDLVSIIVPVYKAEKLLARCLESITNQTEKNIEVILVDDGSPDRSGEMADDYAKNDERIHVIHKKNAGASAARNTGLKAATGNYILFIDADDFVDLDYVEKLIEYAKTYNADIVRCNVCFEYENLNTQIGDNDFEHQLFITKEDFKDYIYNKMFDGIQMNSIWRNLYKTEILNGVFFNEDLVTCEDLIFSIDAFSNAQSFLYVERPLYHYYINSDGLTGSSLTAITKLKCNIFVSNYLAKHLKRWGMNTIKNKILVYNRVLNVIFSKINRISVKNKNKINDNTFKA